MKNINSKPIKSSNYFLSYIIENIKQKQNDYTLMVLSFFSLELG